MKFVEIQKILPDVLLDIRYASTYNFVGEKIDGYIDPIAIGTIELVQALQEVQSVFLDAGYRIKIYDAYRPQKARVFNTSQNYRFSYQPIKWTFSFTFLVKFLDFLYRIFSYVMV